MRTTLLIAAVVVVLGCSQQKAPTAVPQSPAAVAQEDRSSANATMPEKSAKEPESNSTSRPSDQGKGAASSAQLPNAAQQQQLLSARLDGGMGLPFRQFANMFLVSSRINLGAGVGLMTSSKEIADQPLQSPFPASYQPTLREFLDAIALQTFSDWEFDTSGKFIKSDVEKGAAVDGLAIIEFKTVKREKPYKIDLSEGWKAKDHGNWVMHVPPSFPVGMDIYEMGTYSSDEPSADFAEQIRSAVALDWAQRVNKDATRKDFKPAKVGAFDALYYESMIPSQLGQDIKWRQWVFMADGKCYFVVSTILPDMEAKIFPDVEKMLATFKIKSQ